jgi:hypothetical protein
MDHGVAFMCVAFLTGLDARLAANAPVWIDKKHIFFWNWHIMILLLD